MNVNTISVCPVEEISAPVEDVWRLLVDLEKLDLWWDAKLQRVSPAGPLAPGQLIVAGTQKYFKELLHFEIAVKEVDHAQHRLRVFATFPLGITDDATISCVPLGENRCRVSFG